MFFASNHRIIQSIIHLPENKGGQPEGGAYVLISGLRFRSHLTREQIKKTKNLCQNRNTDTQSILKES